MQQMNSGSPTAGQIVAVALDWLGEMQRCVRLEDFGRCREIFAESVVGFGSVSSMLDGIEDLDYEQWRSVWPHIRAFTFLRHTMRCGGSGNVVWIACAWTSKRQTTGGVWVDRPGRMTAVLERRGDRWLASHTHHSLEPAGL